MARIGNVRMELTILVYNRRPGRAAKNKNPKTRPAGSGPNYVMPEQLITRMCTKYEGGARLANLAGHASRIFPTCTHARMTSGRGGNPRGKIRLGTLDRFSCHGNIMCGIFLRAINASMEFARAGNFLLFRG